MSRSPGARPRRLRARPQPDPSRGVEFGWRVHAAQEAWTAKVDGKASILLALTGAAVAAVIAGQADSGPFATLHGWRIVVFWGAVVAGCLSVVLSMAAIYPRLGPAHRKRDAGDGDLIYFGHLRHVEAEEVATRLTGLTVGVETRALSRQLCAMSQLNWWKHRLLQGALLTLGTACLSLTVVSVWP